MPKYLYRCGTCGREIEMWRPVDLRNLVRFCPEPCDGLVKRVFTPTANIMVQEHFRHNQRDFVPEKGDPKWDDLVPVSEVKERQSREVQDGFKKALEQEFLHE